MRHPVALQSLEPLEIKQALRVRLAGGVPVDHGLQVRHQGVEHGRVGGEGVGDGAGQLRAQQRARRELVGEQEGHRLGQRGVDEDGRVQEGGERGLVPGGVAGGGANGVPDVVGALVVRRGLPGGERGRGDGIGCGSVAVLVVVAGWGGPGGPCGRGGGCFSVALKERERGKEGVEVEMGC